MTAEGELDSRDNTCKRGADSFPICRCGPPAWPVQILETTTEGKAKGEIYGQEPGDWKTD